MQLNKFDSISSSPSRPRSTWTVAREFGMMLSSLTLFGSLLSPVTAAPTTDATADTGLEEITVTAEKRSSTIQNTPISISAISGEQLTAAGIASVADAARDIPGLSMRSAGPGLTEFEARGLASNGGAAPTVGFYLDEIPLSPPALSQSGKVVIDPDLYDIDRIEVLRGPQGTLYGSGSVGGTIKIVTAQPKLNTWEGSFQGTLSDTQGGSGNGGGSVALNIPIGDTLALRVVGSDTYRSGWIDRVVVNPFPQDIGISRGNVLAAPVQGVVPNVNTENLYGARASLLFQPNSDFTAVVTAFYQRLVLGGYDDFDTPPGAIGKLAHYEAFNIPEPIADTVHIYSLTLTQNLGFADLTSATAYWNRQEHQTQDASESASFAIGAYPYVSIPFSEVDLSKQFSQEIRLTSKGDDRLHWVGGAFFSDLNSLFNEYGANSAFISGQADNPIVNGSAVQPGNTTGILFESNNPYRITQSALFVDGSYKITDTLKFSTGLRWYDYQSQQLEQQWGFVAATPTPIAPTKTTAAESGFNPRFDLSYSPNADLTTYISASKGFRPGGANQLVPPPNIPPHCAPGYQSSFGPDSVWDYEVGEKAKLFDNWLTINSDFFYIQWKNVQETLLLACGYEYQANAGNGRSFGPEIEINAKLSQEWVVSASGAYTDAKLTQPNASFLNFLTTVAQHPNGTAYCATASGCTAPILNVPKDTASLALIYTTKVGNYDLTSRVSANYTGTSFDQAFFYGFQLPSYTLAAVRLGLSTDKWSANLFVDNLTNKLAETTSNNTSFQFNIPGLIRYTTVQPRTFGTQINYKF
jgi:iron complex outermembrane receptor protein